MFEKLEINGENGENHDDTMVTFHFGKKDDIIWKKDDIIFQNPDNPIPNIG